VATYCEFGPPLHLPLVCRTANYYEELEKWKLVTKLSSLQSSAVIGFKAAHEKSHLSAAENQRGRTGTQGRGVEGCDGGDKSDRRGSSAGGRHGKVFSKVIYVSDLHIKCTRALTFENMSQAISRPFVTCCPAWDPQWGLH
jgi:hypothetical protein